MGLNGIQVIIVGGGPTGLVMANLLGQLGVKTVVFEKDADVYPIPRATHIDEETIRNFQLTGLMPLLEPHTSPFGSMDMVDDKGTVVFKEETIQQTTLHQYQGSRYFDQPAFERILRQGLQRYPQVTLLTGMEVQQVSQTVNEVHVTARNTSTGEIMELIAPWLVGCDGGKSVVRTASKIGMDQLEPPREWLIVDSLLKDDADAWLLPPNFRYVLNPERLTIFANGIGRNKRWEFQLGKGEDMPSKETVLGWVGQFIDLGKVEVTRMAKYAHLSLVAKQWGNGRVFIAGDAAHMMPPSAGQGMCSGIRDAVNLAWKLNAVVKGQAKPHLLHTYEQERRPHLLNILKRTLFLGNRLQGDNTLQRIWRKVQLMTIDTVGPLKSLIKATYITSPPLLQGCLSSQSVLAGHHLPQFVLSDDAIGYHFAVIARPNTLSKQQIQQLRDQSTVVLQPLAGANDGAFMQWLNANQIDFVIVRPDKVIFGAGKTPDLANVLNQFGQWFQIPELQYSKVG